MFRNDIIDIKKQLAEISKYTGAKQYMGMNQKRFPFFMINITVTL
jgi:hypothetical protein